MQLTQLCSMILYPHCQDQQQRQYQRLTLVSYKRTVQHGVRSNHFLIPSEVHDREVHSSHQDSVQILGLDPRANRSGHFRLCNVNQHVKVDVTKVPDDAYQSSGQSAAQLSSPGRPAC